MSTGKWLSRDPIEERGGLNMHAFIANQTLGHIDVLGLAPAVCPCKEEQKDSAAYINNLVQSTIDAGIRAGGTAQSVRLAIERTLIGGGGAIKSGIEVNLNAAVNNKTIDGVKCKCEFYTPRGDKLSVPNRLKIDSAPSILVCGQCIGTDKLGHFFEEGLAYYDIAKAKNDAYAIAWGYWTEGTMDPETTGKIYQWLIKGQTTFNFAGKIITVKNWDLYASAGDSATFDTIALLKKIFPTFGAGVALDPNGTTSMADIAANEAGLQFWKDTFALYYPGGMNFNICNYVNAKWDHIKNPNTPGDFRGQLPPPLP
jgi:hypothetical protein